MEERKSRSVYNCNLKIERCNSQHNRELIKLFTTSGFNNAEYCSILTTQLNCLKDVQKDRSCVIPNSYHVQRFIKDACSNSELYKYRIR